MGFTYWTISRQGQSIKLFFASKPLQNVCSANDREMLLLSMHPGADCSGAVWRKGVIRQRLARDAAALIAT